MPPSGHSGTSHIFKIPFRHFLYCPSTFSIHPLKNGLPFPSLHVAQNRLSFLSLHIAYNILQCATARPDSWSDSDGEMRYYLKFLAFCSLQKHLSPSLWRAHKGVSAAPEVSMFCILIFKAPPKLLSLLIPCCSSAHTFHFVSLAYLYSPFFCSSHLGFCTFIMLEINSHPLSTRHTLCT